MKIRSVFCLAAIPFAAVVSLPAADSGQDGTALAAAVWQASGGENWSKVKAIDFTFVVDAYWLLAPLKLKDRGLTVTDEGSQEIEGAKREVLRLRFDKVGLTPTDEYLLYIDPATKLVTAWDYIPEPGKASRSTWAKYEKSGGLNLATEHKMESGTLLRFEKVKVTTTE